MNDKKIEVTVAYTGQDDYKGEFSPEVPISEIKRKAMHAFGLEESAADQYVIKYGGTNLDDHVKIGSLGQSKVNLVLTLKKPQEKGYVR